MMIDISTNEASSMLLKNQVHELYSLCGWSSASKIDELYQALLHSDTLVVARVDGVIVGLGNAISDGNLVVYYPHLLVHPDYRNLGIGTSILNHLKSKYKDFHQQIILSYVRSKEFYSKFGFEIASDTVPMWIYKGKDH